MLNSLLSISLLLILSNSVYANIEVDFIEGAPKDKFVLTNNSKCNLQNMTLTIDLSRSEGGLIFDTTAMGEGVEVFQPFEVNKGELALVSADKVQDGDKMLSLNIAQIAAKDSVSFTIDVDDTLTQSELGNIRVTDSEISNATVNMVLNNDILTGTFDDNAKARLKTPLCT